MQLLYRIGCCDKYYPSEEKALTAFANTNHDTVCGFSSCKIHKGSGESSSAFNRPLQKSDDPGLVELVLLLRVSMFRFIPLHRLFNDTHDVIRSPLNPLQFSLF